MTNRKWLCVLISIVVSVGLWVYIVIVENPDQQISIDNIPVMFYGEELLREDYSLLITDSNADNGLTMTFSGKLSDLNKLQEKKSEISVNINVTHLRKAQDYSLSYDINDINLPASVSASDITLHAKEPSRVSITLEKLVKVPLQVKVQQNIILSEGFMTGRMTQNYEEIYVQGPEKVVSQIEYAQVILERENVAQTINATLPYTLINRQGEIVDAALVTSDVAEIEVSVPVLMYKDVPLEPSFVYGGGIEDTNVVADVSPSTIRLSGDAAALESIQSIKLSNIDLASLMTNNETVTRTIGIPAGCSNVSGEQEAIVAIQIKNKAIKPIRVSSTNFQYKGLPADMIPNFKTTALLVNVRANKSDIDSITEDNVRVVVDFTTFMNLSQNMTVPVDIYVDGFEGAGVIAEAEYNVLVDVVSVEDLKEENKE